MIMTKIKKKEKRFDQLVFSMAILLKRKKKLDMKMILFPAFQWPFIYHFFHNFFTGPGHWSYLEVFDFDARFTRTRM